MTAELRLVKFINAATNARGKQYIQTIYAHHPQVARWFDHFLTKCASHSVLEYKDETVYIKNTCLLNRVAKSTGRLIAAEVKLGQCWQDARALFKVLLALTTCSPSKEITDLMIDIVPELYELLCHQDGQLLAALIDNKPVYMNMPVYDIISPRLDQRVLNILRGALNNYHTPADRLIRTFNAALTKALKTILAYAWIFFDNHTAHLQTTKLLGARILSCPADPFPGTTLLLKYLETLDGVVLPAGGITVPAPENKVGVNKLTLWRRDEWLLGLLSHNQAGASLVMASPSLSGYMSLWLLLAENLTRVSADPLTRLVLTSYFKLKADWHNTPE
ncbi:MAG: 27 kDa glycoprotein [Firmicutes bacterium]|nr:27 kDa glycoprotein [Bacillota bacterium]